MTTGLAPFAKPAPRKGRPGTRSRADRNGDPRHLAVGEVALTGVQAGPDARSLSSGPRRRRPARSGWHGRVRPSAAKNPSPAVSIATAPPSDRASDEPMVAFDQVVPHDSRDRRQLGRPDDVGEQDRREHPVRVGLLFADARDEATDLGEERLRARHHHKRRALDAGEERSRDLPGHRLRLLGGGVAREHQGRDVDRQGTSARPCRSTCAGKCGGGRRTRR